MVTMLLLLLSFLPLFFIPTDGVFSLFGPIGFVIYNVGRKILWPNVRVGTTRQVGLRVIGTWIDQPLLDLTDHAVGGEMCIAEGGDLFA